MTTVSAAVMALLQVGVVVTLMILSLTTQKISLKLK